MTGSVLLVGTILATWAAAALALEQRHADRVRRTAGVVLHAPGARGVRGWPFPRLRRASSPGPAELGRLASELAAGLRVGRALTQGFEDAAAAAPALGLELRRRVAAVLDARAVGVPLEAGLGELADERSCPEAALLVTLLRVGRRAGTSLPRLLEEYARAMRERADASREMRSLTVQARMSGTILCLLPIGFLAFVILTSARDILPVLVSPAGATILGCGLVMQALGAVWVRRIVRVEA